MSEPVRIRDRVVVMYCAPCGKFCSEGEVRLTGEVISIDQDGDMCVRFDLRQGRRDKTTYTVRRHLEGADWFRLASRGAVAVLDE